MSSYIEFLVASGGAGNPAGPTNSIQFNNGGVFGGTSNFTYTGPSATGAATNTVGPSILGTLNTSGVVDGAALFANVTNTASGAGTSLMDLQVASSSVFKVDMAGNILIAGAGAVSSNTSLTLQQTGDAFGPSGFELQNRFAVSGAVFSNSGTFSLVDFVFLVNGSGGFNGQNNIRYERRPSFFINSTFITNADHEFQIGIGSSLGPQPSIFAGDKVSGTMSWGQTLTTWAVSGNANTSAEVFLQVIGNQPTSLRLETVVANFFCSLNTTWELQIFHPASTGYCFGETAALIGYPQFNAGFAGGGSALLGANCPAVTVTAPYTWVKVFARDNSTMYIPAWK